MSDPTKIRLQVQDDRVIVRLLMAHDMENGLRKDAEGSRIPAHFITEVSVQRNGEVVLAADFGPSIATNPYLAFSIAGGAAGDEVVVSWRDNLGDARSDTIRVA